MSEPKSTKILRSCEACGKPFLICPNVLNRQGRGRFCGTACWHVSHKRKPIAERFWSKVIKTEGCWLWSGAAVRGRAYFTVSTRKPTHAARVAWQLTNGPIPAGLEVCHNCPGGDNPLCVNPAHLFLGTHADNMADAARKRQMAWGESHPQAKLTAETVRSIRRRIADGGISQRQLAREMGLSRHTVSAVMLRKRWQHVV